MKVAVILNPKAGQGRPSLVQEQVERSLCDRGFECELFVTERADDGFTIARRAAERGYDLVIAVGGDGTVNEVINGIAGSDARLGILPMGTVNVLARELKIPLNPRQAIRTIVEGNEKRIDLGNANGRYFTLMAGLGFDADVVSNVLQPIKDILGTSAYVFQALGTLARYTATDVTLEMPDETYSSKAFLVIVANSSTYAWQMKMAPYAYPDDGLLDICVFERPVSDRIGFLRQLIDVFTRRHPRDDAVKYFQAARVKIRSNPHIMAQLDGDPFGGTPLDIVVAPRILPVIVPAESITE